ncbi:Hypothetical predicted protein [Olea europaea subsp. europaea]|uniref:Uncharacterized protein n=1 Tax=Olea europaea subsp. europaea TaxID=158383 RepID=A0A8S0RZF9_OLEEU|nr:Hypothetical predicted protein [Olea europaea subsp. europaea]
MEHVVRTRLGHYRTQAKFSGTRRQHGDFWDMMCRPCPGRVLATAGIQPDFQAFLGSLWARCAGHGRDESWLR